MPISKEQNKRNDYPDSYREGIPCLSARHSIGTILMHFRTHAFNSMRINTIQNLNR